MSEKTANSLREMLVKAFDHFKKNGEPMVLVGGNGIVVDFEQVKRLWIAMGMK